jgi:hypothetical protein
MSETYLGQLLPKKGFHDKINRRKSYNISNKNVMQLKGRYNTITNRFLIYKIVLADLTVNTTNTTNINRPNLYWLCLIAATCFGPCIGQSLDSLINYI